MNISGDEPCLRDSQSCSYINNMWYIFGGQGVDEVLYNDMYTLTLEINETEKIFNAVWRKEEIIGIFYPLQEPLIPVHVTNPNI